MVYGYDSVRYQQQDTKVRGVLVQAAALLRDLIIVWYRKLVIGGLYVIDNRRLIL